jgi:hypothetical protein
VSVLSRALLTVAGGALTAAAVLPAATALAQPATSPEPSASAVVETPSPSPSPTPSPSASVQIPQPEPTPAAIAGRIWGDANANGLYDQGENPAQSVRVVLATGPVDPKALFSGKAIPGTRETTSDSAGVYVFEHVPDRALHVYVVPPDSVKLTQHLLAPLDRNSDFAPKSVTVKGAVHHYGLRSGIHPPAERTTDLDAGLVEDTTPDPGQICVHAWNDADRDGIRDRDEKPVAGLPAFILPVKQDTPSVVKRKLAALKPAALKKIASEEADPDDILVTDDDGELCLAGKDGDYNAYLGLGPIVVRPGSDPDIDKIWTLTLQDQGTNDAIDSDFGPAGSEVPAALRPKFASVKRTIKDGNTVPVGAGVYDDKAPTPTPSVSASPAPGGGGSLPVTGAAVGGFLAAGALLIGGGVLLTVLARRRRSAQ